ncbi:MORC family CW-type Zinc finger protein 3, partial [Plakobranchus ocellatus]
MKITIRGQRVKSKLISKSLSQSEKDLYTPSWLSKPVKIIFGFTCEKGKSEDYGLMLYHRNRLIKAFERVGYQKQPNDRGVGVVGVAAVDFLQPIHNKQDFNKDEKFNSVMKAFATKLNEYWNEKMNSGNPTASQHIG